MEGIIDLMDIIKNRRQITLTVKVAHKPLAKVESFEKDGEFHVSLYGIDIDTNVNEIVILNMMDYALFGNPEPTKITTPSLIIDFSDKFFKLERKGYATNTACIMKHKGDNLLFRAQAFADESLLLHYLEWKLTTKDGEVTTIERRLGYCANDIFDILGKKDGIIFMELSNQIGTKHLYPVIRGYDKEGTLKILVMEDDSPYYKLKAEIERNILTLKEAYEKLKSEFPDLYEQIKKKVEKRIKREERREKGEKYWGEIIVTGFRTIGNETFFYYPFSYDFAVVKGNRVLLIRTDHPHGNFFLARIEEVGLDKALKRFRSIETKWLSSKEDDDIKIIALWLERLSREARIKAINLMGEELRKKVLEKLVDNLL